MEHRQIDKDDTEMELAMGMRMRIRMRMRMRMRGGEGTAEQLRHVMWSGGGGGGGAQGNPEGAAREGAWRDAGREPQITLYCDPVAYSVESGPRGWT